MTRRAMILGTALIILTILLAMCASGKGAQAATTDVPPPQSFTAQGVLDLPNGRIIGQTGMTPCWAWKQGWEVSNYIGTQQYRFAIDVEWCANASKTKVTKVVYNYCLDLGGYFDFDWCHKDKGATGYASIGMFSDWHYHFLVNGILASRHPSVRFDLYATGRVTGTVWYDN